MPEIPIQFPAGSVTKAMIATSAGIESSKLVCLRSADRELFGPTTSVAAISAVLHAVRGTSGTLVGFEAVQQVDTTGADRTISVDLQKVNGTGAYSSVLSAPIAFADGTAIQTPQAGTISSATMADGDVYKVVVTVAGAAGAAATGLHVTMTYDETYS